MRVSIVRTERGAFEVSSEEGGGRVWINGPDGGAVARYSPRTGRDVHRTITEQRETGEECLDCSADPDFARFAASVLEHYGVEIPRKHYPPKR